MDVARLNFSHGTHADHAEVFHRLRRVSAEMDQPVTILQDLQGPKIRTGVISSGVIQLKKDQRFTLTTTPVPGDENQVYVDFPGLPNHLKPGDRILLDDGHLEVAVDRVIGANIETSVILGGPLGAHKGVNVPQTRLDIPGFTPKDYRDLAFGLEHNVDLLAVSFVRSAKDLSAVRETIARLAPEMQDIPIIAKLERPEALENLEEIIEVADGVMVARGDLGVEMPPETVPIAQKNIILPSPIGGESLSFRPKPLLAGTGARLIKRLWTKILMD